MSLVDNATNVATATAFGIDKIVRIFTGSFDAASDPNIITRTGTWLTIKAYRRAHGLTRPVLCEMQWSLDGDEWIDGGAVSPSGSSLAYSDSTYVYVILPVSSGTVYYRVWCLWIDNYDNTNPLVEVQAYTDVPTQFDSRLNYQKIKDQDVLSFSPGTFGATETQTVTHDLGYTPNAKAWFEAFPNEIWQLNAGGNSNPFYFDSAQDECLLEISDSNISIEMNKFSNQTKRAWYRIYYDAN